MSIVEETSPEYARAPGADGSADHRTALALAAIRITRGNPTAEEVAALAVLLAARIRPRPEEQPPQARARVYRLRRRPPPDFIAPGSWVS
ncbi:acyl-CoA carboxylase epsilon subunit [Streptomyces sp. NPDC101733]|uniref:acyl-CoA carboxylase epsilon subunit n=1 Tax=unclassified Streptomyces TaxID=2593676 RepID=UPI003817F103